jgi:hypothetical protein
MNRADQLARIMQASLRGEVCKQCGHIWHIGVCGREVDRIQTMANGPITVVNCGCEGSR